MKNLLSFAIALLMCTSLFAYNGIPLDDETIVIANPTNTTIPVNNIFFEDNDNSVLFIDFEALAVEITNINILRDKAFMMEDDVTDLPGNTIYEINLDIIRKGKYTVELVTAEGIVVHKNIWVE